MGESITETDQGSTVGNIDVHAALPSTSPSSGSDEHSTAGGWFVVLEEGKVEPLAWGYDELATADMSCIERMRGKRLDRRCDTPR